MAGDHDLERQADREARDQVEQRAQRDERDERDRAAERGDLVAGRDPRKDPDDWVTGDEPMTGPQASYLETLAREAAEDVPPDLTKAEASKRIDELQERTGRGADRPD